MKNLLIISALMLASLPGMAQEKVMVVQKTDGTDSRIRVADLDRISFLSIDDSSRGISVKKTDGSTTSVLFSSKPVITIANSKLIVKPSAADPTEIELDDIDEIAFGDNLDAIDMTGSDSPAIEIASDGIIVRGIPAYAEPEVYSLDGRSLPAPKSVNGEMKLNRTTLGSGFFIVKAGSFSAKIKL